MRKLASVLLALSLLLCSIAGLAEAGKEYAGQTLTMMMASGDFENTSKLEAFKYCAEKMGINIQFDAYPTDQYTAVVNSKLATGNAGDLLFGNQDINLLYNGSLETLSGPWADKITSVSRAFCVDDAGELKLAPLDSESNMGFLYNRKVLESCGVTLPITNYNDFLSACEKIKAADKVPVYISNKEPWTAQILVLCCMTPIFEKNPKYVEGLTSNTLKPQDIPELVDLYKRVLALRDLGYINEDYMSATNDMGLQAIANGECAFYAMVDGMYAKLSTDYPDKIADIGMTICPMWVDDNYSMIMNNKALAYLYVVKGKNSEAAKAFVNEMLSQDCLTKYYELNPGKVPYENLGFECKTSPFNKDMVDLREQTGIEYYAQWDAHIYSAFKTNIMSDFWGDFGTHIQNMFSGISPEEALAQWYDNYAANAKALRLKGWE